MKIKSVKIQGFRAFEKEENSTFDFTTEKGEIVDFASVYAPNGFGKTSFYDAVEWGITHQIQRFDRMDDFSNMRKENNLPLLLNNSSLMGKVFIQTTTENFENKINNRKVYKKGKPENEYFQNQILSQDLIDTFIKEDRAEKRYEKFLEIDIKLKKYDSAYKKILKLLDYIEDKLIDINKEIDDHSKSLQTEIDFELEFKKFDEINNSIQFLISNKEKIDLLQKDSFNKTLYDIISSQTKSRLFSLDLELANIKLKINNVRLAREGDGEKKDNSNNKGIIVYAENKNRLDDLNTKILEIKDIITSIEEKDKTNSLLHSNEKRLQEEENDYNLSLDIEKKIDLYLRLLNEITDFEKTIHSLREKNLSIESDNLKLKDEEIRLQNQISQLQLTLKEKQDNLIELPIQKKKLDTVLEEIVLLNNELITLSDSHEEKNRAIEGLKAKIGQFDYLETLINDDLGLLLELKDTKSQEKKIKTLISLRTKKKDYDEKLLDLQVKISSQDKLNAELKEYITQGLEIVTKNNSSECPLCNHEYESFTKLTEQILSNKVLDIQLKETIESKIEIENQIEKITQEINLAEEKLRKSIDDLRKPFKVDIIKLEREVTQLLQLKNEKTEQLNYAKANENEVFLFFGNIDSIEFERTLLAEIESIRNTINTIHSTFNSNTVTINNNNLGLKDNIESIERLRQQIYKITVLTEFSQVADYFQVKLNSKEVSKSIFIKYKIDLEASIQYLKKEINSNKKNLKNLESKLLKYNLSIDEYKLKLTESESLRRLTLLSCEAFENFIKTEFGIELLGKDSNEIGIEFDRLIELEKKNEKTIEKKIEHYKIIELLKDDCLNATISQEIKHKIDVLKNNQKKYNKVKERLSSEKNNLVVYLTNTINKFFYTDLINAIYKKIDPHPDYNSIEFNCEFGDNKPRLQIYTTKRDNNGKEVRSVPALYFSTAQINILSLSIFLARALKTVNPVTKKSVDCIFIDDPIQSMDSINILSFIDLFRGIILSLNKQLIVSTHEENFHLLLQKKIPREIFKSRFIEFETFGKLKTNT